jgi:hypothetical protein
LYSLFSSDFVVGITMTVGNRVSMTAEKRQTKSAPWVGKMLSCVYSPVSASGRAWSSQTTPTMTPTVILSPAPPKNLLLSFM